VQCGVRNGLGSTLGTLPYSMVPYLYEAPYPYLSDQKLGTYCSTIPFYPVNNHRASVRYGAVPYNTPSLSNNSFLKDSVKVAILTKVTYKQY